MSGTVPEDSAMKNWNGCFLHLPGGGTVKRQRWRERHISALFPPKASLLLESVHPQLSLASSLVPAGEFQIRGNRRANDSTYVPVGWPFSLEATLVVFKTPKDSAAESQGQPVAQMGTPCPGFAPSGRTS